MTGKLKTKWLDQAQIEVIRGFGRRIRITQRSGIILNNVSETEDADYGYTHSPFSLIKEVEEIAEEIAERGMDVYVSVNEVGVEVAGLHPGTWDGEFVSWDREV